MADRYTATTITDDKLDRLYAKLDKAQKWRDDYARRLDSVLAVVNPVADAPLSHGYDDSERAVRDFAREVRAAIDGQQPAGPAQPVRVRLTFDDPTQQQLADAQKRAAEVKAELTRSENARDVLRKRAEGECHRADAAVRRAATAEQRLARIRDMADNWERRLPATIRTATAAEAVRNAANGDDRPVMFAVTPAPADPQPTAGTKEFAEQERARMERLYTRETVRADKAEKRLNLSHQARRAKVAQLDDIRRALIDTGVMAEGDPYSHADLADVIRQAHAGDQAAAAVCREDAEHNATRAEQAEQRLAAANRARDEQAATIRRLVNRTASLERQLAERRKTLSDADTLGHKLLQRAENAEGRCTALERQLADMRKAYKDADARATLQGQRAVRYLDGACEAEAAADRYKTAWRSARKRARVLSNELTRRAPLNGQYATEAGRLRDLLRATEDDLADARRRLAQQTPADGCACSCVACAGCIANDQPADGPSLRKQLAAMADRANRPASLATPCAYCAHPYNWHASRGACEFGNETNRCGCNTFTPGEAPPPMNPLHILGIDARPETP